MIATMVDYQERLVAAMSNAAVSVQQLADHLGVSYQAVAKVRGGLTKSFSALNNDKAAQFLGVSASWLASGAGPMSRPAPLKTEEAEAVSHAMSHHPDKLPSLKWEALMQLEKLPAAFWLTLGDDSMGAQAPKGTVVRFDTTREPAMGDAVLLRTADGRHHVRVFAQSIEHGWEARPPNTNFAILHGGMAGVKVLAVLTGIEANWAQLSR